MEKFTSDIFEHKKRRNRQDRDRYLYTDVHEAIITAEQFEAAQVLFENKKHGYKGGVPILQVVDVGVFRGYIPINHHWISDDSEIYYKASNSVPIYKKKQGVKKNYFSRFDLSGYQVVRGQFLTARSELPLITFGKDKITFNCTCTRKFDFADYVQMLLHPTERKIAIRPCSKNDMYSIPWHRNTEQPMSAKTIICSYFCNTLYQIMDWFPDYMYKVFGTLIEKGSEQIVIFNLSGAMPSITVKEEIENTDKAIYRKVDICPEEWGDSFGEEFYNFSMENMLYYLPKDTDLKANEKSRPVKGQLPFEVMNGNEVLQFAENLKQKAGKKDE